MASKHNTGKNPTCPNQPTTREVKNSATISMKSFEVPSDFIASQFIKKILLIFLHNPLDICLTTLHLIFHNKTLL